MPLNGFQNIGKLIIGAGLVAVAIGVLLYGLGRLGLTSLPGDIAIRRGRFLFYFPIVTCIVISVILSLILNLIARWRR